jgi:Phage integrase, N-terminal SAM-like domain
MSPPAARHDRADRVRCAPLPRCSAGLSEAAAGRYLPNLSHHGRDPSPRRGKGPLTCETFRRYVEDEWLPNHMIEPRTRENYTYVIHRYLMPVFGPMRMVEILPAHVREWVTKLQRADVQPPR